MKSVDMGYTKFKRLCHSLCYFTKLKMKFIEVNIVKYLDTREIQQKHKRERVAMSHTDTNKPTTALRHISKKQNAMFLEVKVTFCGVFWKKAWWKSDLKQKKYQKCLQVAK